VSAARTPSRVLVVDDAVELRELLVLLLEMEDDFVVVGEAGNGAEGIEEAARLQPDLILLDLAMPVMDGLAALPRLRSAAPDTKVVVFSGFDSVAVEREARSAGAHGYIEKGVAVLEVVERLRRIRDE
jgi:DNA-binding NarL/FixJ family response regulator